MGDKRERKKKREEGRRSGEGGSYGNLGNDYQILGDFERAIEYHECHRKIAKEVGDKAGVAVALFCLGSVFENRGFKSY